MTETKLIKKEKLAGLFLVMGMVAGVFSVVPSIDGVNFLVEPALQNGEVLRGAFAQLLMMIPYLGFALLWYPLMKKNHPSLAMGATGLSILTAAFILLGTMTIFLLQDLSQAYVAGGMEGLPSYHLIGEVLRGSRDFINHVAMIIIYCGASFMINLFFYKERLLPRWLSAWGMLGALLSIIASLIFMVGATDLSAFYLWLNVPKAFQDLILAGYLFFIGLQTKERRVVD